MIENKKSCPVGLQAETDRVLSWKMTMDELFVPTRKDLIQSNALCAILASDTALEFRKEFRDEQKATEKYLKATNGSKSMAI